MVKEDTSTCCGQNECTGNLAIFQSKISVATVQVQVILNMHV